MQRRRVHAIATVIAVLFLLISARLVWLQAIVWRDYHVRAETVRRTVRFIPASRGRLLDRHGRVLAHDVPSHDAVYTLREVEFSHLVIRRLERLLSSAVPFDFNDLQDSLWELRLQYGPLLGKGSDLPPHRWLTGIDRAVAEKLASRIRIRSEHFPGIQVEFDDSGQAHVDVDMAELFAGEAAVRRLAEELGFDLHDRLRQIERQYRRALRFRSSTQREFELATREHVLAGQLPFELVTKFTYDPDRYRGLRLRESRRRRYPGGECVAQLIGYVGPLGRHFPEDGPIRLLDRQVDSINDIRTFRAVRRDARLAADDVGLSGLERSLDARLRGTPGARIVEVDARGRERGAPLDEERPIPGRDVSLTIDLELCRAMLSFLRERETIAGSVLVGDPRTGEILGLCSYPTYHPERLAEDWNRLSEIQELAPLWNRPFRASLPPGSTFKLVVALGALVDATVDPDTVVVCQRLYDPETPEIFGCDNHPEDPEVDLRGALARSCNYYFYKLGREVLGLDGIQRWSARLGFGTSTGLEPEAGTEATGVLPRSSPESAAIGQGFTATPLQLFRFVTGVANRGKFAAPRLFHASAPSFEIVDFEPRVWKLLRDGMVGAVQYGSAGQDSMGLTRFDVAVKTGTAQTSRANQDIAWLVGFAPIAEPEIVFVAELEHSTVGGGEAAGPLIADILGWLAEHRGYELRATR